MSGSMERFEEALQYQRQHGCDWDKAAQAVCYDQHYKQLVPDTDPLDLRGAAPSGRTNDAVAAANQPEREALAEQVAVFCGLSITEAGRVVERSRQTGAPVLECFRSMFPASYDLANPELLRSLTGAYVQ